MGGARIELELPGFAAAAPSAAELSEVARTLNGAAASGDSLQIL
jgi:hypothetical protein